MVSPLSSLPLSIYDLILDGIYIYLRKCMKYILIIHHTKHVIQRVARFNCRLNVINASNLIQTPKTRDFRAFDDLPYVTENK